MAAATAWGLLRASHPEPAVAVSGLATALAASVGADAPLVGVMFLAGQLSVGWCNDWVDAGRDIAADRQDKPVTSGLATPVVARAAVVALVATLPLSLALGVRPGAAHLVAVASAWLYNVWLKATVLSWLPYAVSFGLVPSIVTLGLHDHPLAPVWATAGAALLGVAAHGANVLPDLEADAATGVRGLPQRLGRPVTTAASGVLLVLATVLLAVGPGLRASGVVGLVVAPLVLAGGLLLARRPGSRAAFLAVLVVAVVDVGLLVLRGSALA